jgi:hypothetical protein
MTFTFLQKEIETILLFATAPIYLTIVGILQSKNLKILEKVKRKETDAPAKRELLKKLRKLKFMTPVVMLIGLIIHILAYLLFGTEEIRNGYFISIYIMYVIYSIIGLINFWLKGAGILKDIGDFNGLPGN